MLGGMLGSSAVGIGAGEEQGQHVLDPDEGLNDDDEDEQDEGKHVDVGLGEGE